MIPCETSVCMVSYSIRTGVPIPGQLLPRSSRLISLFCVLLQVINIQFLRMDQESINPNPAQYLKDSLIGGLGADRSKMIRVNAAAIADAHIGVIESGSIVLKPTDSGYQIIACGPSKQIDTLNLPESMIELTLSNRLVMPAMVNAHTHLDLTHIGPVAHNSEDGFVQWVNMIRENRKSEDTDIRNAVHLGITKSLAGGCIAVGDIAGAPAGRLTDAPAYELGKSPLIGLSYLEFFGIGKTANSAIDKVQSYLDNQYAQVKTKLVGTGVRVGLQPHATNTIDLPVYQWVTQIASELNLPVSTHLAETIEERMFIFDGIGPQRAMLQRLGVWDDSTLDYIAHGNHPVEHLRDVLAHAPMLVAHVNDATDSAIECLAETNTSVAYCPRASEYFGATKHFGPHRYQDMLAAGINVCLGTDSIVNLDTPDRISILDEMRLLARRDGTDAKTLIQMATINGCTALGLDPNPFTLAPNMKPAGLISIPLDSGNQDVWANAMRSDQPPEWVFQRKNPHGMS